MRQLAGVFGSRLDGLAERARLAELGRRALPPFPDGRLVPPIVVPPPPELTPRMDERKRVKLLAAGYRGALLAVYRKQSHLMLSGGRGQFKKHQHYQRLSDAACLLFEAKIAPAAWCLFSLSSWKSMEHTKRPPTVKWVFSCERFETQREWYESERSRWARRIERPVREHVELIYAWRRMWADLLRKRPTDRLSLLAVLDDHFPGESFERAVARAKHAADLAQLEIDRRIAKGDVPWTA